MIYVGQVYVQMQSGPGRSLSLWTIHMSGSWNREHGNTISRAQKPPDPPNQETLKRSSGDGWAFVRFIAIEMGSESNRNLLDLYNNSHWQNIWKLPNGERWSLFASALKSRQSSKSSLRTLGPPNISLQTPHLVELHCTTTCFTKIVQLFCSLCKPLYAAHWPWPWPWPDSELKYHNFRAVLHFCNVLFFSWIPFLLPWQLYIFSSCTESLLGFGCVSISRIYPYHHHHQPVDNLVEPADNHAEPLG